MNIADLSTQLYLCKILSLALPKFYKDTKLSAQFVFKFNEESNGLEFNIGFSPREATEEEYILLFNYLLDMEKLLINDYMINHSVNHTSIETLIKSLQLDMSKILKKIN